MSASTHCGLEKAQHSISYRAIVHGQIFCCIAFPVGKVSVAIFLSRISTVTWHKAVCWFIDGVLSILFVPLPIFDFIQCSVPAHMYNKLVSQTRKTSGCKQYGMHGSKDQHYPLVQSPAVVQRSFASPGGKEKSSHDDTSDRSILAAMQLGNHEGIRVTNETAITYERNDDPV